MGYILSIDQGTTSSRAIPYTAKLRPKASAHKKYPAIPPIGLGRTLQAGRWEQRSILRAVQATLGV